MKIIDLSCGFRAIWFDKKNPLVTYLDKREECSPDFVCDTTEIPQSIGTDFDLIVFDPPHENVGANSHMATRYGHHTRSEIVRTIIGTAKEAHRISREEALMAFKWNDHAYSLDKALDLMREYWTPLFGHHLRNRGGTQTKTQSFWVMLLRKHK